ncbi:MAG TPA: PAS domain S-box protein [Bacteroidetes bacterium]|nr:PAS domain S-box protein [Bacteroidota bacterium]
MALSFFRALDPFAGRIPPRAVVLRTLRLALVLCAVLVGSFGVVYRLSVPGLFDPVWIRVLLTGTALAMFAGTFTSPWVRRHARVLLAAYLSVLLVWLGGLLIINALHPALALGYTFTMCGAGVLLGFAYNRTAPVTAYLASAIAVAAGAALTAVRPETSPAVFLLCVVATSVALFLASYARIRVHSERHAGERMLRDAERLGAMGSWTLDLGTREQYWSSGLYRLVGAAQRRGTPPPIEAFVAPDYRPGLSELVRQLASGEQDAVDVRLSIRRRDGELLPVEATFRLDRTGTGEPWRIVGVVRDRSRQVEYETGLDDARRAAEDANALKSAILANMSHELRTPLTHILGYTQLLRLDATGDTAEIVDTIESGAKRLMETLNAVMDLAQIEAGAAPLQRAAVNVAAEALAVAGRFRDQAEAAGLRFHVAVPPEPTYALADASAVERALRNLLSNAIKFTPSGSIVLCVEPSRGGVQVSVRDTGRGIAPEFLPHLFESFLQESTGLTRSHEGTGLGLAITHRLVTAMGGTLEVESAPGEGSTFTIWLPSDPAVFEAAPVPADHPPSDGRLLRDHLVGSLAIAASAPERAPNAPAHVYGATSVAKAPPDSADTPAEPSAPVCGCASPLPSIRSLVPSTRTPSSSGPSG